MNSTVFGVDEYGNEAEVVSSGYVGEFKYFGFSAIPAHCLACDGSEISRATYSELFEVFGETYGAGDGETTFNLPDMRGAFLRCIGGNAAALGSKQGDAIRNIEGQLGIRPLYTSSGAVADNASAFVQTTKSGVFYVTSAGKQDASPDSGIYIVTNIAGTYINIATFTASRVVPTAAENRPVNYAVNICVVYE